MRTAVLLCLLIILSGCSSPASRPELQPISVAAGEVYRIAFQGVNFGIPAGESIGKYYWEDDELGKNLVWRAQHRPLDYSSLANNVFVEYGYPVLRFDRNSRGLIKSTLSDMNVELRISDMKIVQRVSKKIENQAHNVELRGLFRVYSSASKAGLYEKRVYASAELLPPGNSAFDVVPLAVEKLLLQLLADEHFVDFVSR